MRANADQNGGAGMKRQVALDTETTGRANDGTTTGDHRIIEIG